MQSWYRQLGKKHPAWQHRHYDHVDSNGIFFPGDISWPGGGGPRYPVYHPITQKEVKIPARGWVFPKPETMQKAIEDGRVHFGDDENKVPNLKRYLHETEGQVIPSVIYKDRRASRKKLRQLFHNDIFENPKDVDVVLKLLETVTSDNDIIMDSFAGSGTTAHAVLDLNKEDGGNRKFVLIEMEDYANSLTAERVRRVIAGVPDAKNKRLREGLGGTFSYFELGKPFDIEALFAENNDELPDYVNFARLIFYWATGAEFDEARIDRDINYIGESPEHHVFLYYAQDWDYLMNTGLTLDMLKSLPFGGTKKRLVYAPSCFVDDHYLRQYGVEFLRLPYEIYKYKGRRDAN